jgi:hypothetical protein
VNSYVQTEEASHTVIISAMQSLQNVIGNSKVALRLRLITYATMDTEKNDKFVEVVDFETLFVNVA